MVSFTHPVERAPAHSVPLAASPEKGTVQGRDFAKTQNAHPAEPSKATAPLPPASLGPSTLESMRFLPLELIHPSPFNPRKAFAEDGIAELAESIRVNGLQQNLVVRPHPKKKEQFEL